MFLGVVIFLTIVLSVAIKESFELIKFKINAKALATLKKDNTPCNQKNTAKEKK